MMRTISATVICRECLMLLSNLRAEAGLANEIIPPSELDHELIQQHVDCVMPADWKDSSFEDFSEKVLMPIVKLMAEHCSELKLSPIRLPLPQGANGLEAAHERWSGIALRAIVQRQEALPDMEIPGVTELTKNFYSLSEDKIKTALTYWQLRLDIRGILRGG